MSKYHRNSFLRPSSTQLDGKEKRVCILLNSDALQAEISMLTRVWSSFDLTICADGGANRLHDGLLELGRRAAAEAEDEDEGERDLRSKFVPAFIKGDLDSLRPDVEAFYSRSGGGTIIRDADQDTNDLQKCLTLVSDLIGAEAEPEPEPEPGHPGLPRTCLQGESKVLVVVFGAFGGRFDQQIACLHALYQYAHIFHRMVLIGEGNSATLLSPRWESHTIELVPGVEGPGCSLLPVGNRCDSVSTTGLQWDLQDQALGLGELISSSNRVRPTSNAITVRTSHPLLWCCQFDMNN